MYRFLEVVGDGMVALYHVQLRQQLWTKAKVRQQHICKVCHLTYQSGAIMYRPMSNGQNRMHRICEACIEKMS